MPATRDVSRGSRALRGAREIIVFPDAVAPCASLNGLAIAGDSARSFGAANTQGNIEVAP